MKTRMPFVAVLFSLLAAGLLAMAQEKPKVAGKTVKLLTVGNSFSQNATKFLDKIVEADGHTLIHHRCVIGGSGPNQHMDKALKFEANPTDKNGLYGSGKSLKQELLAEKWDIITIQQASIKSHDAANYRPHARQLFDYIKKYAPESEIVIHQTWAYRVDDPRFTKPSSTPGEPVMQKEMYDGLRDAYSTIAKELGIRQIPVGDAFFLADTDAKWGFKPDTEFDAKTAKPPMLPNQLHSLHVGRTWSKTADGKPTLKMDGHHASVAGEYLGGCVWSEFLFGTSPVGNSYRPPGLDADYARFLQETAHRAVVRAGH